MNNKGLCGTHVLDVVGSLAQALRQNAARSHDVEHNILFRFACIEVLPVLMKSSQHEIYEECCVPVVEVLSTPLCASAHTWHRAEANISVT